MPELPEMETYRTLLQQKISGKTITDIVINREKSINLAAVDFISKVKNQRVQSIERRAKHLLFHLDNDQVLLLHLMLGGWMFYGTEDEKPDHTVQIQVDFGDYHLYFIGLRLGYLHLLSQEEVKETLAKYGPEPLDINFSLDSFLRLIKDKRGRIKTTLIDQEFLSGVGNRYSDEIAWHARILPERKIYDLDEKEKVQLYESIRFVLKQAIQSGGYLGQPLFSGDTKTGGYLAKMNVYDREGKACKRCGSTIIKEEISSRKTFCCRGCQV